MQFSLFQSNRRHDGRTGLCRANAAYNNVFYQCPTRIYLGRREENQSDGNLFDITGDNCSFEIAHPAPGNLQNLSGWQRYFELDTHSTQAQLEAEFDPEHGILRWRTPGPLPQTQPVPTLPESAHTGEPGPAPEE